MQGCGILGLLPESPQLAPTLCPRGPSQPPPDTRPSPGWPHLAQGSVGPPAGARVSKGCLQRWDHPPHLPQVPGEGGGPEAVATWLTPRGPAGLPPAACHSTSRPGRCPQLGPLSWARRLPRQGHEGRLATLRTRAAGQRPRPAASPWTKGPCAAEWVFILGPESTQGREAGRGPGTGLLRVNMTRAGHTAAAPASAPLRLARHHHGRGPLLGGSGSARKEARGVGLALAATSRRTASEPLPAVGWDPEPQYRADIRAPRFRGWSPRPSCGIRRRWAL